MELEILRLTRPRIVCDKCSLPTLAGNSRGDIAFNMSELCIPNSDRHVLPVFGSDGSLTCEGSPSVRQYLVDQPRDVRPEYPLDAQDVGTYRAAFFSARCKEQYDYGRKIPRIKSLICPAHKRESDVQILAVVSEGWICQIHCSICQQAGSAPLLVLASIQSPENLFALDPEDYALMGGHNFVIAAGGSINTPTTAMA